MTCRSMLTLSAPRRAGMIAVTLPPQIRCLLRETAKPRAAKGNAARQLPAAPTRRCWMSATWLGA